MNIDMLTLYFTRYGAIAIFVIVLLEYMNMPGFPAGIIMPLSGIWAAKGNIHFLHVMAITLAAGVLGSCVSISIFMSYHLIFFFAVTLPIGYPAKWKMISGKIERIS
mgnify:CR=1 FL=1